MRENNYKIHMATDPIQIDSVGFQARLGDDDIRDCLLILEPDNKCKLGLLTRPPIDSTVLESVLKGKGGILDIDGARISHKTVNGGNLADNPHLRGTKLRSSPVSTCFGRAGDVTDLTSGTGRFPANLIFKHSEGCRCEGTKKVKGSFLDHECHKMTAFGTGEDTHVRKGYTDEDGKEEIPNWICELGCPVRALDAQSGILKSGALKKGQYSKGTKGRMFRSGPGGLQEGFDNEEISSTEGGASRYFKQVQSDEELDHYLNTLIRRPSS